MRTYLTHGLFIFFFANKNLAQKGLPKHFVSKRPQVQIVSTPQKVNKPLTMQLHKSVNIALTFTLSGILNVQASPNISGGVWMNYRYIDDNDRDEETIGDIADEALILYVDGEAKKGEGNWSYSAELRIGPGSFTDPDNNSTGDNYTLHKAWIGFQLSEKNKLLAGKSQVPFGWKTVNFWPGDIFQAGYGDQMDVGLKLIGDTNSIDYNLAYYHADDWGETSTDTVDDNKHWGSSTTYRKVQTVVADVLFPLNKQHSLGLSAQAGKLQDLTDVDPSNPVDGDHSAFVLYYHGQFGNFYTKAELIQTSRELPEDYRIAESLPDEIENRRAAIELGYKTGNWFYYLDASWADTDTEGNEADVISAYAPGVSYDYGPGWIYLEYLTQDGYIDRTGQINEGDFSALYFSIDFYF